MTEVQPQAITPTHDALGKAGGLWTHTPVDWRGNETGTKPAPWPADAGTGQPGYGTRPGTALPGGLATIAAAAGVGQLTITWVTTTLSDSAVDIGATAAYGTHVYDPTMVLNHSVLVTGLTSAQLQHYRVTSSAPGYTSVSGDQTATPT